MVTDIPLIILAASLAVALAGFVFWIYQLLASKTACDPSPAKGSGPLGILYAFTIGMLPWNKESARLHWLVYLRGIGFHLGIFAGILLLAFAAFSFMLPPVIRYVLAALAGLGALCGLEAVIQRAAEPLLRVISGADDYIAPSLVSVFLLAGALHAFGFVGSTLFFLAASALCLYTPWSKVRHCVYFLFARARIGAVQGHRGLLSRPGPHAGKGI